MEEYGWTTFVSIAGSIASITSLAWACWAWLQKRKAPEPKPQYGRVALTAPKIVRLLDPDY
ncbi:MAG: hypothetical protein OXC18_18445 [Desulfurellaceae bacterium]|nr:hypothetical protein [Desulfurellaceae bacterium]